MRRRSFLQLVSQMGVAGFAGGALASWLPLSAVLPAARPQVALTIDDPKTDLGASAPMTWQEANDRFLGVLHDRELRAALFVCGMRVDSPEGKKLLGTWDDARHLICSHSYSHLFYNSAQTTYDAFAADFLRNEPVVAPYRNRARLFRYPFLKAGDTAEKRDRFRALLKEHDYRSGEVTIDASDWYVDERMLARLARDPDAKLQPYRDYLVAHLLDRASFYRHLALAVLGAEIRHTLLIHYRALTALFLPEIIESFEKAGWQWIDAQRAYDDPVFLREPKTLPAGESLVWTLAAETGKFKGRLRYPGEDGDYEKPKMDALAL